MPCLRVFCGSYLFTLESLCSNEYFHTYAIIQISRLLVSFLNIVNYKVNKINLFTVQIKTINEDNVIVTTVHINNCCNAATHMGQKYLLLYLFRDTDLHKLTLVFQSLLSNKKPYIISSSMFSHYMLQGMQKRDQLNKYLEIKFCAP